MARKKLKNLKITTLALCKRGKNGLKTVIKSQGGSSATLEAPAEFLIQEDPEVKGRLLVVNVAPNLPDEDGEETDKQEIMRAAHEYLRDFRQLDIEHDGEILPKSAAYIAESFIINEGDTRFQNWKDYDGNAVDVAGGWATVIQLNDPELIAAYKAGDWDGISMLGSAILEVEKSQTPNAAPGGNHMTPKEIKALLDSRDEALIEKITAILAAKPNETDGDDSNKETVEAPVFNGDINSVEDVQAFQRELAAHELSTKIASGDMNAEQLLEVVKSMSAEGPSDEELGLDDQATPQERKLARELHKVRKSRNASTLAPKPTSEEDDQELSDQDLINIGLGRKPQTKEAK